MELKRRDFFKNLALIVAGVAVLPRAVSAVTAGAGAGISASSSLGYKVFYTFTASTLEDAMAFRQLINSCGVKSQNIKLNSEGHILSRTEFYPLPNGSMRSEIVFKSRESFDLFLESSKSVSSQLIEFKKQKNIQIAIEPVA